MPPSEMPSITGLARAGRGEHGVDIRHAVLEARDALVAIGEPGAPLVEQDHPRECRQLPAKTRMRGVAPGQVEMRDQPRHHDQVERAVSDHLIGDAHIAVAGIAGLGKRHRAILPRQR